MRNLMLWVFREYGESSNVRKKCVYIVLYVWIYRENYGKKKLKDGSGNVAEEGPARKLSTL